LAGAAVNRIWKEIRSWLAFLAGFAAISCLVIQPFKIPSGSMIPTFLVGDFLIVNKFCYGYSGDSFRIGTVNLLPFLNMEKRVLASKQPERGDVVVFRNKRDKDLNYIKRVIGIPGDKIEVINGVVNINDKPVELKGDGEYSLIENGELTIYKKYIEKLPNGYAHVIIKKFDFGKGYLDNVGPFIVQNDHYFMMGDNRDCSQDSRVVEAVGNVHISQIMGRAEMLFFSSSCKLYEVFKWPVSIRFERFFNIIR
jgi:signal peptidase I